MRIPIAWAAVFVLATAGVAVADETPAPAPEAAPALPPPAVVPPPAPPPPPAPAPAAAPARAVAPAAAPRQIPACPRIGTVPAWTEWVERTVEVPACHQERRVPVCETVEEPVYETRCVPRTETRLEPVYEIREVPLYQKRKVPVHGLVTVPVYGTVRIPVKAPGWNGCSNEECEITLFHREEQVQVGVKRVPKLLGYREETVCCGTTREKVRCGWRRVEVPCGTTTEQVCVGTREVVRRVGWQPDLREVRPASTQVVREPVAHACRRVTVVPDGVAKGAPLPGTTEVLTESELAREVFRATSPRR